MRGSFTPAVARALTAARSWAVADGRPRVSPQDWLAGLLLEEEGRAAVLLTSAGLDVAAYRAELDLPEPQADPLEILLDAEADAALIESYDLALELEGERTVSSTALVLALLRQAEALRHALSRHGLDYPALEQALEASKLPPITLDEPLHLTPVSQEIDLARVIDAAGNRAREALRVIEDHCRFVLDDAGLTRQCKELRHDLQQALSVIPLDHLLKARETQRDVGTEITTPTEHRRESLRAVLCANVKRLQEALRSLEEFVKIRHPEISVNLERLRYRAYTLERSVLQGGSAIIRLQSVRLYALLTGKACLLSMQETISGLAEGGVEMIQLREKDLNDRQLLNRASQVRQWTREHGVLLVVNDRPDLARLVEADGVHLGQEDLPVKEARRLLGPDAIIGVSTHNLDQVRAAVRDGADYIGVGPVFPSHTKAFSDFPGLNFAESATAETRLPMYAIGGITLETLPQVLSRGITRVAVSHALCAAETPAAVARAFRQQLPQ